MPMHDVDTKLAGWRKLYEQLTEAQARLNAALKRNAGEGDLAQLRAEVTMLLVASNEALEQVQKALADRKAHPPSGFTPL